MFRSLLGRHQVLDINLEQNIIFTKYVTLKSVQL
jgi:hypothetical protein